MLIGNGPTDLNRISMIGNDLELDPGIGTCGKNGQGVPVGVGQPTLRMDRITVGGTGDGPSTVPGLGTWNAERNHLNICAPYIFPVPNACSSACCRGCGGRLMWKHLRATSMRSTITHGLEATC